MTTEERLENLERELGRAKRRTRWMVAVVGLVVMGLILAWTLAKTTPAVLAQAVGGAEKTIRANTFIVEDANGKELAKLGVDEGRPVLYLFDENGKVRAMLGVDAKGAAVGLFDENDNPRAWLVAVGDRAAVEVFDANGKPRAGLGVDKDGPGMQLINPEGKVIWAAGGADGVAITPRQVTPPVKAAPPPPPQSYTCPKCDGRGFLRVKSGGTFGITTARPCPFCRGTGKVTSMPPRRGDETVEEHEAAQRALKGLPPRAVEPAAPAAPSRVEPTAPDTSKSERCPFCGRTGGPTGEIRTVDGYPMRVFMCGQGHEWLKR